MKKILYVTGSRAEYGIVSETFDNAKRNSRNTA